MYDKVQRYDGCGQNLPFDKQAPESSSNGGGCC